MGAELVESSIQLHQALFAVRLQYDVSLEEVETFKIPDDTLGSALATSLKALQAAWPKLTFLECVEMARVIVQAASLKLSPEGGGISPTAAPPEGLSPKRRTRHCDTEKVEVKGCTTGDLVELEILDRRNVHKTRPNPQLGWAALITQIRRSRMLQEYTSTKVLADRLGFDPEFLTILLRQAVPLHVMHRRQAGQDEWKLAWVKPTPTPLPARAQQARAKIPQPDQRHTQIREVRQRVSAAQQAKARHKARVAAVAEGRRAVARGDRPPIKEAIARVLGKKEMDASSIVKGLAAKGWLPNTRPEKTQQYISFILSSTIDVFERVARGQYKVRKEVHFAN